MHLCPLSLEQCIPESLLVIAVYFEASQPWNLYVILDRQPKRYKSKRINNRSSKCAQSQQKFLIYLSKNHLLKNRFSKNLRVRSCIFQVSLNRFLSHVQTDETTLNIVSPTALNIVSPTTPNIVGPNFAPQHPTECANGRNIWHPTMLGVVGQQCRFRLHGALHKWY